MANSVAFTNASYLREDFAGDQSTSGGSSERLAKLFAVIPIGPSGPLHVTIVTPVAKRPNASRNARSSKLVGVVIFILTQLHVQARPCKFHTMFGDPFSRLMQLTCPLSDQVNSYQGQVVCERDVPRAMQSQQRFHQHYFVMPHWIGRS